MPRFAIVVGEASGDQLARGLIEALKQHYPDAEFVGLTGPLMRAAGCKSWGDYQQIALMGLVEVLRHVPRLRRLLKSLETRLLQSRPDVLIGIDAPDFNLRLEKFARRHDIPTVQYVCPSVWAWRQGRVKTLRTACDLILCLLPFEKSFLEAHGIQARFVGHPLADEIGSGLDAEACRSSLDIAKGETLALLPGSRLGEIRYLAPPFLDAVTWLRERRPELSFVMAAASAAVGSAFAEHSRAAGLHDIIDIRQGVTRQVIGAADIVLVASGTATLETMLLRRPMVVAYRANALTAWIAARLVKVEHASLPNLLAGEALVPEFLQDEVTGGALGEAVLSQLESDDSQRQLITRFDELAVRLQQNASAAAAEGVISLLR